MEKTILGVNTITTVKGSYEMKVLYFNNCWFTNVGEAFIDIGGMKLTKIIFGENSRIGCLSAMTNYYMKNAPKRKRFSFNPPSPHLEFVTSDYLNADYIILPGMVGTIEFLNAPSRAMVDTLVEKGCKLVFLGLGGEWYTDEETDALKRYFDKVKPTLIISRDNDVYEQYKNVAPCVKGIDCAFWSVDVFDPRGFRDADYDVVTFNRIKEPKLFKDLKNIVRPKHMQYSFRKEDADKTTLISDTPYDYLTIYANAKHVYTDLVHATIISMMYGTPVKYWENGKRFKAFYALDAIEKQDDFLYAPEESLNRQKTRIVEESKEVLFSNQAQIKSI